MNQSFPTLVLSSVVFYVAVTSKPVNVTLLGGCASTEFGCCADGVTPSDMNHTNCNSTNVTLMGGCASTLHGCCNDNVTACSDHCLNCPVVQ